MIVVKTFEYFNRVTFEFIQCNVKLRRASLWHISISIVAWEADVRLQMFLKIGVLRNFAIFTLPAVLKACNCIKKRHQHRCFLVNIEEFLRTAFFIEHLRWLLLLSPNLRIKTINHRCTYQIILDLTLNERH